MHARQVLAESIQFRTTVVADIHKEIREQCNDGWDKYLIQKQLLKAHDKRHIMSNMQGNGFVSTGNGTMYFVGKLGASHN